MKHSDTIDRVGIDEVQQANKDGTSSRLGEDVGHHISTFDMAEDENTFGDEIAQKRASTHNVLSLLESNRVKRHIDGGLGVRVDPRRTRWSNAKIDKNFTDEDNFFGGEHGTKVLCLSAGQ